MANLIYLNFLILDQTYGKGYNAGGHLDAGQVEEIIRVMKANGVLDERSQIRVTHISHEGNDLHEVMEQEARKKGYRVAYDGLVVEL